MYWLGLVLTIALLAGYACWRDLFGAYQAYLRGERQVQEATEELNALHNREQELREHVEELDSDPLEIEAAIRQNKNKVRQGEVIYRIEPEAPDATP